MIVITLPSGFVHYVPTVDGSPDFLAYSTSIATQSALQAAYDAGKWEEYTPPEPAPEPEPPNWTEFRLALMVNTAFRNWAATLPADWREDLKACAILANAEALQTTYSHLASIFVPEPTAAAEWQEIAETNQIPVSFS